MAPNLSPGNWRRTGLNQGHYYGPSAGVDSYAAAKQDFATRSELIPRSALFTPEQLTEIYRSVQETLDSDDLITDERQKCLKSTVEQIEHTVSDLQERLVLSVQAEQELVEPAEGIGMQYI